MTESTHVQNHAASGGELPNTQAKARPRTTEAQRAALLERFERSGLSAAQFAAQAGIHYQTFCAWRRKHRELQLQSQGRDWSGDVQPGFSQPAPKRWIEAVLAGDRSTLSASQNALRVHWRGLAMLELTEAGQVPLAAALLQALEDSGEELMLSFSGSLRILLALEPCDMRKGFNGLYGLVADTLKEDPRSGTLFVFTNRRRNRLKVLYWDGTGLWLLTKRLEQGTFSWPPPDPLPSTKLLLAPGAFAMLTDGIDLRRASLRPWYGRQDLATAATSASLA